MLIAQKQTVFEDVPDYGVESLVSELIVTT